MKIKGKSVLVCNCEGTMSLDADLLGKTFGQEKPFVYSQLCRSQQESFQGALNEGDVLVACGREAPLFEELREGMGENAPSGAYVDIREKAGWGLEGNKATPKIAAMLAEAALPAPMVETISLDSNGVVLVYGADEDVLEAATMLKGRLSPVMVMNTAGSGAVPQVSDLPIFQGIVKKTKGHLGGFTVTFDGFAPVRPSAKESFSFTDHENGIEEEFDLILDLSHGDGLFGRGRSVDGYFKVAPTDKAGLFKALLELSDMVGEFAKPRYSEIDDKLCAHSRNSKIGCTKCMDACSASAILSNGDAALIDPYKCEGCGDCQAVCPTGAVSYTMPNLGHIHQRMYALLHTYHKAGGEDAVLLVHDSEQGEEALAMLGQYGDGLPANVIPFALNSISILDHGLMLGALGYGAKGVVILAPSQRYETTQTTFDEMALASDLLEGFGQNTDRFRIISQIAPDELAASLSQLNFAPAIERYEGIFTGTKRQRARKALEHLGKVSAIESPLLQLEKGAPYGGVVVNQEGCTMCMACVGACPTNALRAGSDRPVLSFVEVDCVQCGLCKATCPEKVITLDPRINLTESAIAAQVLNEDEPAVCPECGKEFGSKSAVDHIVNKLDKLGRFGDTGALENLRKCEDCRVVAIAQHADPFNFGERPKPRTAKDYIN